jgi:signal peptidase I
MSIEDQRPNPIAVEVASSPIEPPLPPAQSQADCPAADPAGAIVALIRQTVEFLVVLSLSIILFRTFAAEAYIVPTGSMAPTLLGLHKEVDCANCKIRYVLGMDEQGRSGRAVCPNCGQVDINTAGAIVSNGDRLLVQKFLFDVRGPRRWEAAVFQSTAEPNQAYVKRVVALPGEAVQIRGGDVYIDGRIARKGLAEFRAMRQLVYDNNFLPADVDRYPRWAFRRGSPRNLRPSGWKAEGTGFVHASAQADGDLVDWLDYRHWDPDTGRYGPVRDFYPYNGGDLRGDNVVTDLMLDAKVSARPDARTLVIRINPGSESVFVTLPIDGRARPEARRNGRLYELTNVAGAIASSPADRDRSYHLEVAVVDRRLLVAIDGKLAFDPVDFDVSAIGPVPFATPLSIGVQGGGISVSDVKVYRDVYYTSALANALRLPFGVETPFILGPDEYFVLGDNSPVSNDSRFWEKSPVVRRKDFLGKPFLVHLPGQLFSLRVFGRSICWIPDPREIRYIR